MKKLLCLVLSVIMIFSCFSVAMTASAAEYRYRPDGSENPDGTLKPDIVGKVIDPILMARPDSPFAESINELGYKSIDNFTGSLTKENFNQFIANNYNDKMLGVSLGYLYENKNSNFYWSTIQYPLAVSDRNVHQEEINASGGKKSVCTPKNDYEACREVLYGYEYDYDLKNTDVGIFEDIVEEVVTLRNPSTGRDEFHYNYYYLLDKGTIALVKANANKQIINTICKKWGDGAIYADKKTANTYVVKIANFIGNLLYPDFTEIAEGTKYFTKDSIKAEEFFRKVTELSGLDYILDTYWCNSKEFDVKTIMNAFGTIVSEGAIFNIELEKGVYMGGRILTDIYREFMKNPVDYTLTVLQKFCRNYSTYKLPIQKLFQTKFPVMIHDSREVVSGSKKYPLLDSYIGDELETVDGLIKFITDCIYVEKVDDGVADATNFEFAPIPTVKFATAADMTELYLYMLCYLELNRIYENNAGSKTKMIDEFINKVSEGNANTVKVLQTLFKGDLTLVDIHLFYSIELTYSTIGSFTEDFSSSIKKAIMGFFENMLEAMYNFMNLLFGWTGGLLGKE